MKHPQHVFLSISLLLTVGVLAETICSRNFLSPSDTKMSNMATISVLPKRATFPSCNNVPSTMLWIRSSSLNTRSLCAFFFSTDIRRNRYHGNRRMAGFLCHNIQQFGVATTHDLNKAANPSMNSLRMSTSSSTQEPPSSSSFSSRTSNKNSSSGIGFGKTNNNRRPAKHEWKIIDVPLVFVPGMKGTHLAFENNDPNEQQVNGNAENEDFISKIGRLSNQSKGKKKKRAWLTLSNLLNFPPRPDDDPARDLSLPLTYDYEPPSSKSDFAKHYPRQHQGKLVPDGIVDHIIEVNLGRGESLNYLDLNLLPFYGHCTKSIREMDIAYHQLKHDGKLESTDTFQGQDGREGGADATNGDDVTANIVDQIGSFVERTSFWDNSNNTTDTAKIEEHPLKYCRPTAIFSYDWRRPLPELGAELHKFCEEAFPNQPVQIVAHSLGGLMTFDAMRSHPEKYAPGAVVVGVPFETGIQYLQDLHKGYYTELDRCRQFTPGAQFTMSSHWGFFPISKKRLEDRFVDLSVDFERDAEGQQKVKFDADKSGIGKTGTQFQPVVKGKNAYFDFYNPDEWERLQLGIFGPEFDNKLSDDQRYAYKEHMRIQMAAAKDWRRSVLGEVEEIDNNEELFDITNGYVDLLARGDKFPPFVACATDKIPTVNQILRRRRHAPLKPPVLTRKERNPLNEWEYDYINGRSVPGDGRIDFDKAFPPEFITHKVVTLDSAHAKQMCWEESGGSWGKVYDEVVAQIETYVDKKISTSIVESEKNAAVEEFESATTAMAASALQETSTRIPLSTENESDVTQSLLEEAFEKRNNRRKSIVKSLMARARGARKVLQRRRRTKNAPARGEKNMAAVVRQKRFSFRRRRV